MKVQQQIDQLVTHRAAEWFELLQSGTADRDEFTRWVGESPRHLREFMAIVAMNEELPQAFAHAGIDREALLARISSKVTPLSPQEKSSRTSASKTFNRMKLAAAVTMAVGLGAWLFASARGEQFSTAVGEQRMVTLTDGSLVYLNANSVVEIRMSERSRDIELVRGEALFQVARDAERPFEVKARDAVIQVVGTQFNVKRSPVRTLVSVLEGKVRVSNELLSAGEAVEVSTQGSVERKSGMDVENAIAWRQRQLVFSRTSLEEVAADFNRFHRTRRLILENVKPGSHHFTGTFAADDVESFAAVLAQEEDLRVERHGGDYIIRMR